MRTVVFGDSIAKGIISKNGKLETIDDNAVSLVSKYFGEDIDNISLYGQTLKRIYDKKIVDKYLDTVDQTDKLYAIFSVGGNDSDYDWKKISENPYIYHKPKTPIEDFERILIEMIEHLKRMGVTVVLTTLIPLDSKSYFDNVISKIGDPEKIMLFLEQDVENISRHQHMYSKAIIRCAMKTNCIVLDIRKKMKELDHMKSFMCTDGVHPNEIGYQYLAKSVIQEIMTHDYLHKWNIQAEPSQIALI
jgi:acyl-CoA thioesterase I